MQMVLFLSSKVSLIHFMQFGEISGNYFLRNEPLADFQLKGQKYQENRSMTDTFPPSRSASCFITPTTITKQRS